MELQAATLYVVATPIGNLADLTARAVEVLKQVDVIAAEDTRHSKLLLQHYAISTSTLSLHEHNEQQRSEMLLEKLRDGATVALISDAGTPLISDPGYRLVNLLKQNDIAVVPIPGCCAAITALSASGLASQRFSFEGFLSAKPSARRQQLQLLDTEQRTMIFYESPRRLLACLEDMLSVFGAQRPVCLARELTKLHETIEMRPLGELIDWVRADDNQQRGECVLLVEGNPQAPTADLQDVEKTLAVLIKELPVKQAAAITAELTGIKKNAAYELALKLQQK